MSRIRGFDGLRGIAAAAVVLNHTILSGSQVGGYAVGLFFVLSGFLIVGILHRARQRIEASTSEFGNELKGFWTNRVLRIAPVYYIVLFAYFGLKVVSNPHSITEFAWYLLYLQNFYIGFQTLSWSSFTHTWSLAIEQQFYFLAAPLLLAIPARRHIAVLFIVLVCCAVVTLGMILAGTNAITIYTFPTTSFILIGLGGLASLLVRPEKPRSPGHWTFIAASIVAIGLSLVPVATFGDATVFASLIRVVASSICFTTMLLYVWHRQDGVVANALETRLPLFLGRLSYSLYVVHVPIAAYAHSLLQRVVFLREHAVILETSSFALVAGLSLLIAYGLYLTVEAPYFRRRHAGSTAVMAGEAA